MRVHSFLVPGALLFTAAVAHAQTDLERATARDAANSGRAAFESGQYEQAIDSFTRAESLVHAPPHLLFLARSQAKLGRLVAAHETYLKITREALKPNAPKAFNDAQSAAEQELPAVDARLPYVTVSLQGAPADGVTVQMDSISLPEAMIGIPLPADPGQHTFKASGTATGDPVTVTLAEAAKQTVVLKVHSTGLPAAGAAPIAGPAGPIVTSASSPQAEPLAADTSQLKGSGLRLASYASFGVGAVGLGVGTYFLLKSSSTRSDANKLFDDCHTKGPCEDRVNAKDSDANSQRTIGVAGVVVGGVGVAAGITLLVLGSSSSSNSARQNTPHVIPVVGLDTLGLAGTF